MLDDCCGFLWIVGLKPGPTLCRWVIEAILVADLGLYYLVAGRSQMIIIYQPAIFRVLL